jgi:AcrR family transcriptional regulator
MPDQITSSPPLVDAAAPKAEPRIDRRRLRSARTKQAIIEAYLDLIRDKPQIPTASRIAERAGCSVRSVFERFSDLHALRVAVMDYVLADATARVAMRAPEGDRRARLRTHVETRGMICEQWLPMWRSLTLNQGVSVELRMRVAMVRQIILRRIEMMYEPELSTVPQRQQRQTLIAIESLIDFESWGRMREDNGLSVEQACAVWIQAIDRLLPATPVS